MTYVFSPRLTLLYILLFSVVMDISYGVLVYVGLGSAKISLLYRVTILAAFVVVLIERRDFESWVVKLILALWLVCLSVWLSTQASVSLLVDVTFFLKTVFPMCITFMVFNALERAKKAGEDLSELAPNLIMGYGLIACCAFIFSLITGLGFLTYGKWAFGIKSFFTGGNDIGLTLLISLVFCWGAFWVNNTAVNLFKILLVSFCIILIGSRAAWGGFVAVSICFSVLFMLFKQAQSRKTYFYKMTVLITILSVGSLLTKYIYDNIDDMGFYVQRITELTEGISPRAKLENAGVQVLQDRAVIHDVFGQGSRFFFDVHSEYYVSYPVSHIKGTLNYRAVEQDFLDMYGLYGVLLGTLFLLYHFAYLWLSIRLYWRDKRIAYFCCLTAVTLFLFHGLIAGHAMLTSQVATMIGGVYGYMRFKAKYSKEELSQLSTKSSESG